MQKIVFANFQKQLNMCKLHLIPQKYCLECIAIFSNSSQADVFIGALDESPVVKNHLIASRAYYHDHLTWCVQNAKPIPKWQNISYLFVGWTPIASIAALVILLVTVGYFLMVAERTKTSSIELLQIIICCALGLSAAYFQPQSNPVRILFAFGILGGMLFATLASSVLMTIATKPIQRAQIQNIQEILMENFSLVGDQFTLDKIIQRNEVNKIISN